MFTSVAFNLKTTMPFTDLPEGQTHSYNDGCGEPEHNQPTALKERLHNLAFLKEAIEYATDEGMDVDYNSKGDSEQEAIDRFYLKLEAFIESELSSHSSSLHRELVSRMQELPKVVWGSDYVKLDNAINVTNTVFNQPNENI